MEVMKLQGNEENVQKKDVETKTGNNVHDAREM